MPWTPDDIPAQHGRVAVVTGANGGLGLATTRELARKGAHVVMAVRNLDKAEKARDQLLTELPTASLELVALDLGSLASVEAAARTILETHPTLDLLVNNAGVMAIPEGRTEDGFERQFGINHLGHFALTARLLPALAATAGSRVVAVTSTARHLGRPVDPANPHLEGAYEPWKAYGQSKLANLHFAVELHHRLQQAGAPVASLVAHPGFSNTELQQHSAETTGGITQRFGHGLVRKVGTSPDHGAHSQLRAATDPDARSGELYAPRFVNFGPAVRRPLVGRSVDRRATRRLWIVSAREAGVNFEVAKAVAGA